MIQKTNETPHEQRRGRLRNGNPSGDFAKAARCGAKNRRGILCKCPAMPNGRCRLHGGLSTGPKTPEGIERIRQAATRHGRYSQRAKAEQRQFRSLMMNLRDGLRIFAELADKYPFWNCVLGIRLRPSEVRLTIKRFLTALLLILLLSLLLYAEKQHAWEQGVVVSQDMSSYNAGGVAVPIGTSVAAVPITKMSNVVVIDTTTNRCRSS